MKNTKTVVKFTVVAIDGKAVLVHPSIQHGNITVAIENIPEIVYLEQDSTLEIILEGNDNRLIKSNV